MGLADKYKDKAERDRAEVAEFFKSKNGQWTLWIVFGGLAAWFIISGIWSAL